MKYIRTYETEEKFLTDKDSTSRGFRLKPTLYKYSEVGDHVHLELDDPRKHGDSTYIEITLDSDTEFSFYIGNAPDDTQTIRDCKVDWGDGDSGSTRLTADDKGFKLSHNYKAGSYSIELYAIEDYSIAGDGTNNTSLISHPSSVKRVVLGIGVVRIGECAFYNCTSLTSIHIPESVTRIGGGVFVYCSSLTSVYIPEGVISIGNYVFDRCSSLTSINIPRGVTSIGEAMFMNCSSLTSIDISEGVNSIGFGAFYGCSSLTSIHIPESVTSIGTSAFCYCPLLTSINIPESVTSIETYAFYGCSSLISIDIPEGITNIGEGLFGGCSSLTSIHIPESVTSIDSWGFSDCTSLTSISIPERVSTIGEEAFNGCSTLASISSFNTIAPTLSTTDSDNDSESVFHNLPPNGTLHIKPGATGYDAWLSALPSGWTIVEDL